MEISGAHIVVTGAASGIGKALVRAFAQEGARAIVAADLDGAGARAVADEVGGSAVELDVRDEAALRAMVDAAVARDGPIDLFCSNAGISMVGSVDVPNNVWQRIWEVNVMAHVYAARAVLPSMLERKRGYLLQTASAAGLLTQIGSAPYSVTKHASVALAEWLSIEYADRGIGVSVICPQAVRTAMTAGSPNGGGPASVDGMLEPEEVARCAIEGLREGRFLILPHPTVREYAQRKVNDPDRWLAGMRRLRARVYGAFKGF